MNRKTTITANELAAVIRHHLGDIVPVEDMEFFVSENYETGAAYFNLRIRYPSMAALLPDRRTKR